MQRTNSMLIVTIHLICVGLIMHLSFYSSVMACNCNYHSGGCSIRRPASPGNACRCSYKGFWICIWSKTGCRDPSSHYCRNPDKTKDSCILGGGDCGGY
uniref:Uncharacterized protein n=1 Tax=Daphnia galeata TaxID=27404 RepID=A0A8J2S318_9CRUS|nr:unnamed protein product [Daphnia galeata]